jgi:DNA-binding XRE family transcriptional regulator
MTPDDLHMARRRLHLTQGELAEKLGLHTQTICRWETGRLPVPRWVPFAMMGLTAVRVAKEHAS